jgi:hypothetical protein
VPPAPAPATTAGKPPAKPGAGGKKILGMSPVQLGIVGVILAGGILYIAWKRKKSAAASSSSTGTGTSTGSCADGSTPDASGDCPQDSSDMSGQLATLQQEIADLQASAGGEGSSGGSTDGGSTGTTGTTGTGTTGTGSGTTGTTGTGSTGSAGSATGSTGASPAPVNQYPAPTGLAVHAVTSTSIAVSFNAVPGATSYTVAVYQMNGKQVGGNHTVMAVAGQQAATNISGLTPTYQYQVHAWANGGKTAPPHASATVTMPKS